MIPFQRRLRLISKQNIEDTVCTYLDNGMEEVLHGRTTASLSLVRQLPWRHCLLVLEGSGSMFFGSSADALSVSSPTCIIWCYQRSLYIKHDLCRMGMISAELQHHLNHLFAALSLREEGRRPGIAGGPSSSFLPLSSVFCSGVI